MTQLSLAAHSSRFTSLAACVFAILLCTPGQAALSDDPAIVGVHVGFAGRYRVGFWTPVEIRLEGGDREREAVVELVLPDGDDVDSRIASEPIKLLPHQQHATLMYVKFGRLESPLTVELRVRGAVVDRRTFTPASGSANFQPALSSRHKLVVVLAARRDESPDPLGIDEAIGRRRQRDAAEPVAVVAVDEVGRLPNRWIGYEGLDWLVISADDEKLHAALEADPRRVEALAEWVELGGRLLLAAGADAPRWFAAGAPLARLLPGTLAGPTRLPRAGALETFSGTSIQIPLTPGRRAIDTIKLVDVSGVAEAADGDLPLVVRTPRALGMVVFVAVDLARAPLAGWQGRSAFVARLFDLRRERAQPGPEPGKGAASYLGIIDLAGQLRGALDQFPGIELAHFGFVSALAFGYVLLIGPLDFLLLKWIRRMEWTWLSFPLVAASLGGLAFALAGSWKAKELRLNQVDLVDIDVAGGRVRGTTWINLYSPQSETYDLSLAPRLKLRGDRQPEVVMSWQGLPGGALGGMEQSATGLGIQTGEYLISKSLDSLQGVPVAVWSTKALMARWQMRAEPGLSASLTTGADGVVEGSVTSNLPLPLENCLLASGRWVYLLGQLKPGQTVPLRAGGQLTFQSVLKGSRLVREKEHTVVQVNTPYDPASFDVLVILRQMMFHELSGSTRYAGLSNRYQSFVDLSDHLELRRAVLWGEVDESAAEVRRDGQPLAGPNDRHWTVYRFVLSVQDNL
jgi:hypothetical protein